LPLGLFDATYGVAMPRAIVRRAENAELAGTQTARAGAHCVRADSLHRRAATGHDQIDLVSESYGTRLALLYAQTYPERVHRSVPLG
jgi:hypothetical protein